VRFGVKSFKVIWRTYFYKLNEENRLKCESHTEKYKPLPTGMAVCCHLFVTWRLRLLPWKTGPLLFYQAKIWKLSGRVASSFRNFSTVPITSCDVCQHCKLAVWVSIVNRRLQWYTTMQFPWLRDCCLGVFSLVLALEVTGGSYVGIRCCESRYLGKLL
jgi:hypothetical protein